MVWNDNIEAYLQFRTTRRLNLWLAKELQFCPAPLRFEKFLYF
jgi:hypothetical protein